MKKIFSFYSFLMFFCLVLTTSALAQQKNYIKVSYIATPVSQYSLHVDPEKHNTESIALGNAYNYHASLIVDLKTQQSIYRVDSLVMGKKPEGMEHVKRMINDSIAYVIKESSDNIIKYEKIFQREFYSKGKQENLKWKITDKTRIMSGLNCRQAVPEEKDFLMNVWFTNDIPLISGPMYFNNLPGLVVRAEDFFWTVELDGITYLNAEEFDFEEEMNFYLEEFNANKGTNLLAEKQLYLEKAGLIRSMRSHLGY